MRGIALGLILALLGLVAIAQMSSKTAEAATASENRLVVYSGRSKALVEPLIQRFQEETGIRVEVRYAGSTELANLLLEEGNRTPADVFFSQDPGALGALEAANRLSVLPGGITGKVDPTFRSPTGVWVGISGRARVYAYSTERVVETQLPKSVLDLAGPEWAGRVGWAPTNASFHLFVTAMRQQYGEQRTEAWLRAMKANKARDYSNNRTAIQGVADGEIDVAIVNHYYLKGFLEERGDAFPVRNHRPSDDLGGMMSIAGAGILKSARHPSAAARFVEYMLTPEAQSYFEHNTGEYRLVGNAEPGELRCVELDLGSLSDLRGTMAILRSTGILP
jgi:iron(III) transport system substrate-binding protein